MQHIYCCDCGTETDIQAHQMSIGSTVQCPACKKVGARVLSRGRGSCWITVDPKEVEFYDILGTKYDCLEDEFADQQNGKRHD